MLYSMLCYILKVLPEELSFHCYRVSTMKLGMRPIGWYFLYMHPTPPPADTQSCRLANTIKLNVNSLKPTC